jgi:Protein tyrosine and serine/threonine kinase
MMITELLNQNQQFSEIIELCKSIHLDGNSVQVFKWRCIRLSNRVNSIKHATTTMYYKPNAVRVNKLISFQLLLVTCLEDVREQIKKYLVKDEKLSRLLVKDGTAEEEFMKLNERLMHCVDELQLPLNMSEVFNPNDDTDDFVKDVECIKENIASLVVISDKLECERSIDACVHLVERQTKERHIYTFKRVPNAKINIDLMDLSFERVVGKGGFGTVWRGKYKQEVVAIKKLQNLTDPHAIEDFRQEANIMRRISHQRMVNCFGICESPDMFCMVLEYCENGSLYKYIQERSDSNWALRKSIALDIAVGMRYLHRLRIVHRDLKSANVLLDRLLGAKIADFGLSILKNTSVSVIKLDEEGTPQYMVSIVLIIGSRVLWNVSIIII